MIKLDFIEENLGSNKFRYATKLNGNIIEGSSSFNKEIALSIYEKTAKELELTNKYVFMNLNSISEE